jgi:thioredoxin-related protein
MAQVTRCVFLLLACGMSLPAVGGCGRGDDAGSWDDHTQGLPFVFGYEQGMEQARAQGKPAMLFMTTTWCGWCKKLAHESFNDPEIKRLLTENFVCVIVDGDTESAAKSKLGVRGYPHVVFQSADGKKLAEQQGYTSASNFRAVIERAL